MVAQATTLFLESIQAQSCTGYSQMPWKFSLACAPANHLAAMSLKPVNSRHNVSVGQLPGLAMSGTVSSVKVIIAATSDLERAEEKCRRDQIQWLE